MSEFVEALFRLHRELCRLQGPNPWVAEERPRLLVSPRLFYSIRDELFHHRLIDAVPGPLRVGDILIQESKL